MIDRRVEAVALSNSLKLSSFVDAMSKLGTSHRRRRMIARLLVKGLSRSRSLLRFARECNEGLGRLLSSVRDEVGLSRKLRFLDDVGEGLISRYVPDTKEACPFQRFLLGWRQGVAGR
jgi:hypothetical protein